MKLQRLSATAVLKGTCHKNAVKITFCFLLNQPVSSHIYSLTISKKPCFSDVFKGTVACNRLTISDIFKWMIFEMVYTEIIVPKYFSYEITQGNLSKFSKSYVSMPRWLYFSSHIYLNYFANFNCAVDTWSEEHNQYQINTLKTAIPKFFKKPIIRKIQLILRKTFNNQQNNEGYLNNLIFSRRPFFKNVLGGLFLLDLLPFLMNQLVSFACLSEKSFRYFS